MRELWRHRSLLLSLTRRDLEARYRGTLGGGWWTLLQPLMLTLTYYFVFGVVLRARFPGDPTSTGFVLYFLAGMLPWLAISETLSRSPQVILEHHNFIKKLIFPAGILPAVRVLAAFATEAAALAVFLLLLAANRGRVPWTVLCLPAVLVPQLMLTAGLSFLLAAAGVFLKDLTQLTSLLLTLWFFLTPICYPESALPEGWRPWLNYNPLVVIVRAYRAVLVEGRMPDWPGLALLGTLSVLVYALGWRWFRHLRRAFPDVL